jgi:hypothetical protein
MMLKAAAVMGAVQEWAGSSELQGPHLMQEANETSPLRAFGS